MRKSKWPKFQKIDFLLRAIPVKNPTLVFGIYVALFYGILVRFNELTLKEIYFSKFF